MAMWAFIGGEPSITRATETEEHEPRVSLRYHCPTLFHRRWSGLSSAAGSSVEIGNGISCDHAMFAVRWRGMLSRLRGGSLFETPVEISNCVAGNYVFIMHRSVHNFAIFHGSLDDRIANRLTGRCSCYSG